MFASDAKHESIERDGNITTAASRTINNFESLGILQETGSRSRFCSLILELDIFFGFLIK